MLKRDHPAMRQRVSDRSGTPDPALLAGEEFSG
jgi:hypothetical protein